MSATRDDDLRATAQLPRMPRDQVRRTRLDDLLISAPGYPIVLVSAPAGAGKTTLVGQWMGRWSVNHPVAWLSCRGRGSSPAAFWSAFVAAVTRGTGMAATTITSGSEVPSERSQMLERLVAWLAGAPRGTVIVCDDLHEVTNPEIHRDLQFVVNHLPGQVTLVILTRVDPPLALHQARLEDRVLDLGTADLAFTRDEVASLLRASRVTLDDEHLTQLIQRTDGWAAGLRLAVIAMRHADDPHRVVDDLAGTSEAISGYLTEQVLTTLDVHDQQLLLDTCVVDVLTEPLVAALTSGTAGLADVEDLAHRIGFLTRIDGPPVRYRYHPLFAELLRSRQRDGNRVRFRDAHRRAAAAFAAAQRIPAAVGHAVAAEDWEVAAELLVPATITLFLHDRVAELVELVEAFPQEMATRDPRILAARGLSLLVGNERERATTVLQRARDNLAASRGGLNERRLRSLLDYVAALAARVRGDAPAALTKVTEAGPDIPGPDDPDFLPSDLELRAAWRSCRAAALMWNDELGPAVVQARLGYPDLERAGVRWPVMTGYGVEAIAAAFSGRLTNAQQAISRLAHFVDVRDWSDAPYIAYSDFASAWVALERGDTASAVEDLDRARRRWRRLSGVAVAAMIRLLQARVDLVIGAPAIRIHRELEAVAADLAGLNVELVKRVLLSVRVEAALAEGDLEQACALTAQGSTGWQRLVHARYLLSTSRPEQEDDVVMSTDGADAEDLGLFVRTSLTFAALAFRSGDQSRTEHWLGAALDVTAVEGFVLPYQQLSTEIRPVLISAPVTALRHSRLIADLLASTARSTGISADLVNPLTAREGDVLRMMAAGMEVEEIAAALVLSGNTIRTHVRNLYRKLSVQSRRDALLRAQGLELL
ncbi:MAG: LuxR C-terminal-related transcriptional regulator [Propionibacteriaceae bacterium]